MSMRAIESVFGWITLETGSGVTSILLALLASVGIVGVIAALVDTPVTELAFFHE
jgi:hypothetical protein